MGENIVRQNVKDSLFCDIFSDRENALSLYNAINGTSYTDVNEIEIITLKDVIFIGYRNDVSIFFDSKITLWEHQSTINYNMPLRGLIYYSECINGYLEKRGLKRKIYRKPLVKIPAPDYYVLYNGNEEMPDRQEMHLSDAFMTPSTGYEWTAKLININADRNRDLMEACASLRGYSALVQYMRDYIDTGLSEDESADKAIERCISEGYLREYLLQKRGEAKYMLLHFDENDWEEEKKEAREEGRTEGENTLADTIDRLRSGESKRDIISSGVPETTVALAAKYA